MKKRAKPRQKKSPSADAVESDAAKDSVFKVARSAARGVALNEMDGLRKEYYRLRDRVDQLSATIVTAKNYGDLDRRLKTIEALLAKSKLADYAAVVQGMSTELGQSRDKLEARFVAIETRLEDARTTKPTVDTNIIPKHDDRVARATQLLLEVLQGKPKS